MQYMTRIEQDTGVCVRTSECVCVRKACICIFWFAFVCSYIYSEVVSVSVETAPSLVYAARKYMLPKLVRACCLHLSENLNVNNVIEVLEASVIIDDTELERKCLQLIVQEPRTVLTGTEILTASRLTMKIILQMDSITIEETVIYETCIAWAKHQLQTQNPAENHPTDQQIRDILGDLLYMIRFPIMQVTEFAEITEIQTILTPEEKMSIFYFLTTKMKDFQLMFPTEPRRFGEECWIERAVTSVAAELRSGPVLHAINFTADKDILLTGIGLYTGYKDYGYAVDVEILQSTESLFRRKLRVPYTKDANQFKVSVTEPLPLKAGVLYSVTAWCHGSIGHYGETCQAVCTKGKVTFTFSRDQRSVYTTPTVGQI